MPYPPIRQNSKLLTRPSPIKGINAFDGIGSMPEGYALLLRNFYAQPYGCQVRRGFVRHADGITGEVETVMSHNVSAPKLYCFAGETNDVIMYEITAPNVPDPVQELTGLSSARWQHINFPNVAGVQLVAVNGADDPIWIKPDGTVERLIAGDGTTANTIAGIDPTTFVQVYSHQKRLWFVEKDTTYGWYLPPDQVFGVAETFDFGPNWTRGGSLVQIITWTIDDGNGADDHLAAISSEGEVSIYQGIDPSALETWQLQGVYFAGAPVAGHRVATRFGGDILILTQFGVVYLSDLLKSTKVNPSQDNSGRMVQQLVSSAVPLHGDKFGWQPFVFPGANMVMVNIPSTDTTSYQYVQNDITKAWSEFIGYEANCWELHQQLPFYGSFGAVYRAWEQNTDDALVSDLGEVTPGAEIRAEAQTTFSFYNEGALQKQFQMVRPVILSAGEFRLSFSTNVDFSFQSTLSPAAFQSYIPGKWDEGFWDQARWAGGLRTFMEWQGAQGLGICASIRLLIRSTSETYWATTDWLYEPGGVM